MERLPEPIVVSVTDDGNFCAVVIDRHLNVYDVIKNKLLYKVKRISNLSQTKVLKFSPSNGVIAWLQTSPEELDIIHVNEDKISRISPHPDLHFLDILWSPDGKSLASFSIFSVFIDIYTVGQGEVTHTASISGAKEDKIGCPLAQFSPDGEYFATVSDCNQGYCITVYNSEDSSWDCIHRIVCSDSYDIGGLLWCLDSASLLVWQSGRSLQLRLWTVDGLVERSLAADDTAVCCVCLSDCGRVAAVLTADSKVRILDLLTWRLDMTEVLVHHPIIHKASARSRLKESDHSAIEVSNCVPIRETLYELHQDNDLSRKKRPLAQFSVDSKYLTTYEPTYPSTLWIWRLVDESVLDTVVALRDDTQVTEIMWHKEDTVLAANLSSGGVLVWTPERTVVFKSSDKPWPFTAQEYLASLKTPEFEELLETSQ